MYLSEMVSVKRNYIKYQSILLALLIIISAGCKRNDEATPYYDPEYGDLKYTIDGIKDVSIEQTGELKLIVNINRSAGKIEDVTMSASNVPQGVTVGFEPGLAKPSFNTIITIRAKRAAIGTYQITIRGSSITSGFTEKKLTLNIIPYSNIANGLVGQFLENGMCSPSGAVGDTVDVVAVSGVNNKINIKGFWSGVWSNMVTADLNPSDKTLNIPSQVVNGLTITGKGSFDDNVMIIGYRVQGTTVNDTCTSTFSRL